MAHSFATAPHFYLSAEVEATALARMREGLLAKVETATGARLTITDILLKVCAQALAELPEVNVAWAEDAPGGGILRHAEVNMGLAVSLDAGLVVPVLRGAAGLTLGEIARRRSDLVERGRAGKLTLADLEGGTFTLSKPGDVRRGSIPGHPEPAAERDSGRRPHQRPAGGRWLARWSCGRRCT